MRWAAMITAAAWMLATGAAHADSLSVKDWAAVCDNTRTCAAFGFSSMEDEEITYLKLERAGEGAAAVAAVLTSREAQAGVWRLKLDGRPIPGLDALTATADHDLVTAEARGPQAQALVQAIRDGQVLEVATPGGTRRISLAGGSAVLRWLDDRQRRAGTATALVASGPKPASAVPSPPAPPLVRAAAAVPQAGLPKHPSSAVKAALSDCDPDIGDLQFEPTIARLSPGVLFWAIPCSRGAYNVVYDLFLTDEAGGKVRPLLLPGLGPEPSNSVMNVDFDPKTQTLANFDKGRGLGDCGGESEWLWDGRAFVAARQTLMPECRGVTPDDWPLTLRTRSR